MANIFDLADYILQSTGSITVMKLQKLAYYCQAWSLVWDNRPIFSENIKAWSSSPVCIELYNANKGKFTIENVPQGDRHKLTLVEQETINRVLWFYKDRTSQWLSDLILSEDPWIHTRKGMNRIDRGDRTISNESMQKYYSNL